MSGQYVVSARKYRPYSFESLLGQEAISITLKRAISQQKTAHAYLFCGPRGVGKTSAARIFAKAINCINTTQNGEACGICESCKAFEEQRSLNIYELDAASNNSTDDIRRLINEVSVPPQFGNYKIYIIDEIHMLSSGAFNAFLKTLEEPPSYVIFIMATTEKHKILPTIISRCQVFDFKPISSDKIVQQLSQIAQLEGISYELEALKLIALKADGGMRDALSLFDRIASFGQGKVSLEQTIESLHVLDENYLKNICKLIHNNDTSGILHLIDDLINQGFDPKTLLVEMENFLRKLILASDSNTIHIANLSEDQYIEYSKLALDLGKGFIYKSILRLNETEKNYRTSNAKRLLVEMALIGLTSLATTEIINDKSISKETVTKDNINRTSHEHPIRVNKPTNPIAIESNNSTKEYNNSAIPNIKGVPSVPKISNSTSIPIKLKSQTIDNTFSSSSFVEKEENTNIATKIKKTLTPETLKSAWQNVVRNKILSPMAQSLLSQRNVMYQDSKNFIIEVNSITQKEDLIQILPTILKTMQAETGISDLRAYINIVKSEDRKAVFNNNEWFEQEKKNNPQLQKMMDDLDLGLI